MLFSREIRAIRERDPASRSTIEAILTSPGLHAIALHRVANWLWRGVSFCRRVCCPSSTGRSPGSRFTLEPGSGRESFIDHGMGVVIGETASVGDDVTMYQGVTLGGTGKQRGKRHPTIEDHAVIGVGASVLGAVTIGAGARVGAGSVVLKDVPPHTTAVGMPARAVSWRDPASGETRRLEHLPDPRSGYDDLAHAADRGARGARARDRARPRRPGDALSTALNPRLPLRLITEEFAA